MADSAFKTQVSKNENINSASNVLFIQVADEAGNVATITGGKLDVNASVTPEGVYVDDAGFTPATDNVNASGFFADETATDSVNEGDIGIARMTLDRKQLMVLVDKTTDANRLVVNSDGSINVNTASAGTRVCDYKEDATATNANHDYTVTTAKTLLLGQVLFASSGKSKFEIKTGPLASLVTKAVAFLDQDSFGEYTFATPISVPDTSTGTVRIVKTNRQGVSNSMYTTIIGTES